MEGQLLDRLLQAELPVVLLDAPRAGNLKSGLTIDYSAGIWSAVDHLAKSGHTEVAVIHGPLNVVSAARYLDLLREAISEYDLRLLGVVEGDGRPEGGARGAQILLGMKRTPTAILCGNDLTAIGAMGMSTRMGFSVPDQLSIVGCDDIALAGYSQPSLSTVRIPRDVMGCEAFRLLEKMTGSGSRRGRDAVVTTSFVARGSSGPVGKAQHPPRFPLIRPNSTKSPAASANSMKKTK